MGVIVSAKVYMALAVRLNNAQTFNVSTNDAQTHERLWFLFGKTRTYVVCKATDRFDFKDYIKAGILVDLSNYDFVNAHGLHSRICAVLGDSKEYVFQCHQLRNLFASKAKKGFRWNGCEWESIMNPDIIRRSSYMTGLFTEGIYWDTSGVFTMKPPKADGSKEMVTAYEHAEGFPAGQGKLYSLMYGFSMTRDIIYIGSAPGEGWQTALNDLGSSITVYSFDPRELVDIENASFSVMHVSEVVTGSDFFESIPPGNYDFIWDVRGDTSAAYEASQYSLEEVYQIVRNEIRILNTIMASPRWAEIDRVNIKVKVELLNEYFFPKHARLYPMPFTIRNGRVIHELRAVFRNRAENVPARCSIDPTEVISQMSSVAEKFGSAYNEVLFSNSMLLRYDHENFIYVGGHRNVSADINLFCINRNSSTDVAKYCDFIDRTKRPMITSFFKGDSLTEDEADVDEIDLIRRSYAVCDSRVFIPRKLADLYFFTNHFNYKWYGNELTFAETYLIMDTEMSLRLSDRSEAYDILRNEACREAGYIFL